MTVIAERFRNLGLDLQALLWPVSCAGCGAADRECCDECRVLLREAPQPPARDLGFPVFARWEYLGVARALVRALKHEGRVAVAGELGEGLRLSHERARSLAEAPGAPVSWGAPLTVAIPSRARSFRRRGFRQLSLLANAAGIAPAADPLRATAGRRGQAALLAHERESNARRIAVRDRARRKLRGASVVLLDDVVTTGATLRAAAAALEAAGAVVIAAAVVCAVPRRDASVS